MICTVLSAQSESQLSSVIQAKAIAKLSIIGTVPILCYDYTFELSHYITDDQLTRNHLLDSPSQVHHQKHIHIKITIQPQALNPRSSILVTARESTHIKCPNSHPHLDRKIKASGLTGRAIS